MKWLRSHASWLAWSATLAPVIAGQLSATPPSDTANTDVTSRHAELRCLSSEMSMLPGAASRPENPSGCDLVWWNGRWHTLVIDGLGGQGPLWLVSLDGSGGVHARRELGVTVRAYDEQVLLPVGDPGQSMSLLVVIVRQGDSGEPASLEALMVSDDEILRSAPMNPSIGPSPGSYLRAKLASVRPLGRRAVDGLTGASEASWFAISGVAIERSVTDGVRSRRMWRVELEVDERPEPSRPAMSWTQAVADEGSTLAVVGGFGHQIGPEVITSELRLVDAGAAGRELWFQVGQRKRKMSTDLGVALLGIEKEQQTECHFESWGFQFIASPTEASEGQGILIRDYSSRGSAAFVVNSGGDLVGVFDPPTSGEIVVGWCLSEEIGAVAVLATPGMSGAQEIGIVDRAGITVVELEPFWEILDSGRGHGAAIRPLDELGEKFELVLGGGRGYSRGEWSVDIIRLSRSLDDAGNRAWTVESRNTTWL